MKILILGGGPGGLYAGLLLKKANPGYDIHVIERNPANATYGWGVVFSDRTLATFREADYNTYQDITEQFVIWHAINIHFKGQVLRSGGHSFAGMSRRLLLNILQNRCLELGVGLTFEQEFEDLSQLEGYDLVIAADGVNSIVRRAYETSFGTSLELGKAKFVWYGTDRVLDAFTFVFRENEHGLFQAHSYPFDGQTSTFIIECEEAVWRKAGLDQADEAESIVYCQELFADFLDGCSLLSNKSEWINFVTVKNSSWRHENIVLLGDSAHTAHYSIGSGTKLAMDGAIALANAFDRHDDMETALNEYEMERRPRVAMLQEAAAHSQLYFENVKRYLHLQPWQFAYHLLTRSGRIHYDNLRVRDALFMDGVDQRFSLSTREADRERPVRVAPPPMFLPLTLRGLSLSNRVVVAPNSTYGAPSGLLAEDQKGRYLQAAQSGAALVLTEPIAVSAAGRITSGCAGIYTKKQQKSWREVVQAIHDQTPARIGLRLNHAGRRGSTRPRQEGLDRPLARDNWSLLAPSAVPYSSHNQIPKAMGRREMEKVREEFVLAAQAADEAGFDLLQLHFAHGYLLASFLSPLANQREDEYGGSLENRLRFPLDLFDAVRVAWPAEKPLAVALNASDWARGGLTPDDAVVMARILKEHGCDLFEVLAGQTVPGGRPSFGPGFLTDYSDQIRLEAGVPTLAGGYLTTSGQINNVLAAGRADLCILSTDL